MGPIKTRLRIRDLATTAVLLLLAAWAVGCGGGTSVGGTFGSAETMTFEGWEAYKTQSDSKAEELFRNALSLDPSFSEAYNGLAWLNFRRAGQADGDRQTQLLITAKTDFERATAASPENVDAWAGLAGTELAGGNYAEARDAANRALSLNSRYFSSHDNIDFRDLHLVLAESYFFLGWFADTQQTPDPNNALYHLDVLSPGYKAQYSASGLTPPDLILKIEELQKT